MQSVKINRVTLLAKLKDNRDNHAKDYADALVEYRKTLISEIESNLRTVMDWNGTKRIPRFSTPSAAPVQYLKDYDRVIEMLTLSVDDTIELSTREFENYVQDQWSWSENFGNSTKVYSNSVR